MADDRISKEYVKVNCVRTPILAHLVQVLRRLISMVEKARLQKRINNGMSSHRYLDLACVLTNQPSVGLWFDAVAFTGRAATARWAWGRVARPAGMAPGARASKRTRISSSH